jgi:hypothetical protein
MRRLMGLVLSFLMGLMGWTLAVAQEPHAHQAGTKKESKAQPKVQSKTTKASTATESSKNASKPQELPLAPQEMSIAERVHVGHLPCELGASVRMSADANAPGYFNLQGKGYKYRMRPVATSTGAIRLEDEKAGAVWLQLANKSMLMDQKNGRRLADECAHPEQVAFANEMKVNPPPALIDVNGSDASSNHKK